MSKGTGDLATMLGTYYPTHFVVAVVHDRAAAEGAVAELREAGFGEDEVALHDAAEVLANDRAFRAERGVLERLGALFPSEEEGALKEYLAEAERGGSFVTVHAPERERRDRAAVILKARGGHAMRYYGERTISDLG